jgi:hypothetical protein
VAEETPQQFTTLLPEYKEYVLRCNKVNEIEAASVV